MGIRIKGKSGGVLEIVMPPSSTFAEIKKDIGGRLSKSPGFFSDSAVLFSGKVLTAEQKAELQHMMGQFGIERVLFSDQQKRPASSKPPQEDAKKDGSRVTLVSREHFNAKSVFVAHTLRSGQRVECEGDVVVLGDVNDGAEVIAGGSIAVMGTLRGLAHAGATGRADVVVAANVLVPKQLRISGKIAVFPEGQTGKTPEIVEYKQGSIVIRPLKPQSRSF